jgi:hypothetical protein
MADSTPTGRLCGLTISALILCDVTVIYPALTAGALGFSALRIVVGAILGFRLSVC